MGHSGKIGKFRVGALALVAAAVALTPTAAFAAGSGYAPSGGGNTGTATGLPGSVVSATTIQPSGGTANATIGTTTISVDVPAGAFTGPVQLVITDAAASAVTPSGGATVVVTFGVGFYENGTKVTGTFPAVTVTVTSSAITAGSTVSFVTGGGLQAVSGASIKAGSATFTVTSDPVVEVATPVSAVPAGTTGTTGSAISGATTAQTGKPFFLEGLLAVALASFGFLLLVAVRLRRRAA